MKAAKITIGAILALLLYWSAKILWAMFWGQLFFILKTLFMVALVGMALYVVWKILGARSAAERD